VIIGPEGKSGKKAKGKGRKKRKAGRAAGDDAVRGDGPSAAPATSAASRSAVTVADATLDASPVRPAPVATVEDAAALVDRLAARVDALLDGLGGLPRGPVAPVAPSAAADGDPAPAADGDPAPAADGDPAPADDVVAPATGPETASARLVARELLRRGVPADRVARTLRDGYGVAEPEPVLAAVLPRSGG